MFSCVAGDSYKSMSYLFRISISAISKFIPEVCDAIFHELKTDYMKVTA